MCPGRYWERHLLVGGGRVSFFSFLWVAPHRGRKKRLRFCKTGFLPKLCFAGVGRLKKISLDLSPFCKTGQLDLLSAGCSAITAATSSHVSFRRTSLCVCTAFACLSVYRPLLGCNRSCGECGKSKDSRGACCLFCLLVSLPLAFSRPTRTYTSLALSSLCLCRCGYRHLATAVSCVSGCEGGCMLSSAGVSGVPSCVACQIMGEGPAFKSRLKQQLEQLQKRKVYKSCVVRVLLPDRTILQLTFAPHKTLKYVRGQVQKVRPNEVAGIPPTHSC